MIQNVISVLKINRRLIHVTIVRNLDDQWRRKVKLPKLTSTFGPLTDLPDYSYLDNRPTPYGVKQRQRIELNRSMAKKIIEMTKEVDYAVSRHKQEQLDKEIERQKIIDSKLKPKGEHVLKSSGNQVQS